MGPQAIPDIGVFFFCVKDVFKITEIIEPTGCFNQNHVSLVFDDYKLSLQWEKKKKKFSTRKIIPPCGQTDSSQIGTRAHFPAIWKILPLAGRTYFSSPSSQMLALNAVTLCKFTKVRPRCHCPKTSNPAGNDGFPAWKKIQGFSEKVLLLLSLGATVSSFLPIRSDLVVISHIAYIRLKETFASALCWMKMALFGLHSRCMPVYEAAVSKSSLEGEIFFKYNFTTRNNFWG